MRTTNGTRTYYIYTENLKYHDKRVRSLRSLNYLWLIWAPWSTGRPWRKLDRTPWISNTCISSKMARAKTRAKLMWACFLTRSYQQLTSSMVHLTVICELHMLFMSEVSPVVTFARTKIILARANIHGVRSNFLHGLLVELRTRTVGCVPDPFLPA